MEKEIRDRYNDTILQQAMQRFDIAEGQIELLDGFESFIYEFQRDGRAFILRVAHSRRRTEALIQGEVDWINYLADGGAGVSRAIFSTHGRLVEPIDDGRGGQFLATAFEKAPGTPLWERELPADFDQIYGQTIGKLHALSKRYVPRNPACVRPQWNDPINIDIAGMLPASDAKILGKYQELRSYLESLPQDQESYGLIHQDAHGGNFFVDDQHRITLFDFDDCVYSWYIYDIAMVIFYAAVDVPGAERPAFTRRFVPAFMQGYQRETEIAPVWFKEIRHFLKLREIDLYAVIHRSFDVENLDDPWCARYMDGRRENILQDSPFIDVDFTLLA